MLSNTFCARDRKYVRFPKYTLWKGYEIVRTEAGWWRIIAGIVYRWCSVIHTSPAARGKL